MANEWISVKERLPDEEQNVLVLIREIEFYGRHKEKRTVYHWVQTGWYIDGEWATTYCFGHKYIREEISDMCDLVVTHWMPLPELPNKNGLKFTSVGRRMTNYEKLVSTNPKFKGMKIERLVKFIPCKFCKYADKKCVSNNTMNCVEGLKEWLESEALKVDEF